MLIRIKKLAFLLGFLVLLAPLAMASGGTTGTITKPPEIVTYAMVSDSVGKDFENEPMFKELEEITGVHLEFRVFNEDDMPTQYALMAAADDMPDIAARMRGADALQFGLDGLLMSLKDLDEYRPNFLSTVKKYSYDFETFLAEFGTADGDYYVSPSLGGYSKNLSDCFAYRKDIFEKENIAVPKTSDELYQALKTLKQRYPKSVPYMMFRNYFDIFYIMFGVFDYPQGDVYYNKDAYKDALNYVAKMYADGIIDQEWPTRQYAEWNKALNEPATVFLEGAHGYSFYGNAPTLCGITEEENTLAAADPFGPAGKLVMDKTMKYFGFMKIPSHPGIRAVSKPATNVSGFGISLNANIKYPDVAGKWLDFFYSEYGAAWTTIKSPEGVNWVNKNPNAGTIEWPGFGKADVERRVPTTEELDASYSTYERSMLLWRKYLSDYPSIPYILPATGHLSVRAVDVYDLSDDQVKRRGDLIAQVDPVVAEYEQKFILGKLDVGSGWAEYLAELKKAGLDELLKLQMDTIKKRSSSIIEPVPNKTKILQP